MIKPLFGRLFSSTSRTVPHTCPVCHRRHNAVTEVSESPNQSVPTAGDFSICFYCHTVCVFNADHTLRIATADECATLPRWARELVEYPNSEKH